MLSLAHRYNRSFVVTKQPPSCICVMFPDTIFQSLWNARDKVQVPSTWNSFTAIYVSLSPSKSFLRNILLMVSSVWEIIYLTLQSHQGAKLWPGNSFFAQVGSRVVISGQEHGVLRYLGPVHFQVCSLSVLLGGNAMFFLLGLFSRWILNYHLIIISTPDWHLVRSWAG